MYSTNEWDRLKTVIVGSATGAKIPPMTTSLRTVNYANLKDVSNIPVGEYPQQVIDEANEDLEKFVEFLHGEDVVVYRPNDLDTDYYKYCPRDNIFLHSSLALASPMPLLARKEEYRCFNDQLPDLFVNTSSHREELYNKDCIGNPDILALTEIEPAFDAANIIRANDHVLYLVSNSGNEIGAKYLQELLGDAAKVCTLSGVYSYMHIDSTVAFLREGLMLLNPSRIKDKSILPYPFNTWDAIYCPEPTDIGHYPGYCNASVWINMNLFSVSPNLVALEQNQTALEKELKKHNIESAMLPMRHQRTLGGGFHCVTLDLIRKT